MFDTRLLEHIHSSPLTPSEMVQACCIIAREQLEIGDYEAARAVLSRWWEDGQWPRIDGLGLEATAELLLTCGSICGWLASTRQTLGGNQLSEGLLNGAIAIFEHLGQKSRVAEARVELGYGYYRQGLFDLARQTLRSSMPALDGCEPELRIIALIRLAIVDRHAGKLHDALNTLNQISFTSDTTSPLTRGRFHLEFATTLKNLGFAENYTDYIERALEHYQKAIYHFEMIGNHRYAAIVENNQGFLLSTLKRFQEAETHLIRARRLFDEFGDDVRRAQVDETLAQLYLASGKYERSQHSISIAVETLENIGEEALLSEALTTQGLVLCRLSRRHEAKPILERARRVAERCGDDERAGVALLIMIEEMCDQLSDDERREIGTRASQLLANSQQAASRERLSKSLERIAEAHAAYEQLREKIAHAEKMAALGELSFGVAHNVNNALTGILGRAQLLLRTSDRAKMMSGLELIIKSADDGARIIKRIQDFARQKPSHEFQPVSVAKILEETYEMTRPKWELRTEAPISFVLDSECSTFVMGDPVELREVLVNMIYNAVDAMPHGGELRVSTQQSTDRIVVHISDTGTGMTPEVKSRLFDPFFTTKGQAGTGMGLAVSFGIIRRHGGSIDVESEHGVGTKFLISLPIAVADGVKDRETRDVTSDVLTGKGVVTVLVVDDEAVVREVLTEALEGEGCRVITAENGEVALQLYDEHEGRFDAVFTDVTMPEMSGWELATEIRKRSASIRIAVISGWTEASDRDARQAVKADWVVSKPFDIDHISQIADEIAGRRHTTG